MRKFGSVYPSLAVLFSVLLLCVLNFGPAFVFPAEEAGQAKATAAPAAGTEIKVGLGLENRELTGASDAFEVAPDTKIYAWSRVQDAPSGGTVSIIFKKGDKEVFKKDLSVPAVPYRINAYRTFRAGDEGDWNAVVAGPDGKELASTAFKVTIKK